VHGATGCAAGRTRCRRGSVGAEQQASHTLPSARLSSEPADGSPAQVLIARSAGADLLILGRAYPLKQTASKAPPAMGPVARACLHDAACPVVLVVQYEQCAQGAVAWSHLTAPTSGRVERVT
jgi:hypothetical protein